jgi:hypothetical protein
MRFGPGVCGLFRGRGVGFAIFAHARSVNCAGTH